VRALVIGGAGFVGGAACKELMRRGVETIAAGRSDRPYGTFTSYRVLDRTDAARLAEVIAEVEPDVVLDCACYQPSEMASVIEAFRGERYVFVSTGSVYPELNGKVADEDDFQQLEGEPPAGREPFDYATGKRWCETLLRRSRIPSTIVRPPAVIGAADHTLRIAAYVQRVADGGPVLLPAETADRQAGLAWVRDVGFGLALACDTRRDTTGKTYNVGWEGVSVRRLVEAIGQGMGKSVEIVLLPHAELPPGASPYGPAPSRPAGYSIARARSELGFAPSALEDAVAEVLAWFRAEHPSHPGYAERAKELELAAARN
jgi:nucleoside-diphosphate-sugar epimerase